MSDPTRLLEEGGEADKALLRAWSARQPSEAARLRTLAALGVGVGTVLASGNAGASLAPKAVTATSSLLKWLGVVGAAAMTAGAVSYAVMQRDAKTPAPAPALVSTDPPPPASPPPAPSAQPWAVVPEAVVPTPPVPAPSGAHASAPPTPPRAPGSALDEEVRAIDHAREALAVGDGSGALPLVDAYDTRYPAGALAQESAEIRIEALFRSGKRAQAERLATKFLAAHPTSPYARVIHALMQ